MRKNAIANAKRLQRCTGGECSSPLSYIAQLEHPLQRTIQVVQVAHTATLPRQLVINHHRVAEVDVPCAVDFVRHAIGHALGPHSHSNAIVQLVHAGSIQKRAILNAPRNERDLPQIRVAKAERQPEVLHAQQPALAALLCLDGELAAINTLQLAPLDFAFLALDAALIVGGADVARAVCADELEEVGECLLDVRLGRYVEELGAVGGVALGQAELVADGEQAVGDGGCGGELVGFGEEGGGVALADLEVPVCRV